MSEESQDPRYCTTQDLLETAARPTLEKIRRDQESATVPLKTMLRHIEEHLFDRGLNVANLRQACRIRDNSLVIRFHRETFEPPKAYISHRRLEVAARLLIDTRLRIWRIAELVGYSNLGVFSKAFNRWANQRPKAFRSQIQAFDMSSPTSEVCTPRFLKRAVAGRLSLVEAEWLFKVLLKHYPETKLATASGLP